MLTVRKSRLRLLATLFFCAASAATQNCGSSKDVGVDAGTAAAGNAGIGGAGGSAGRGSAGLVTDAGDAADKAASYSCPSLDSYCGTHCVSDWATAQHAATWCVGDGGTANNESVYIRTGCAGFNVVYLVGTDNGTYYYYDAQSGVLVGIGNTVGRPDGSFCRAGTTPLQPPGVQCGDGGATPVCGPFP
jgi:hypothetical protein